jgi:hypothetical protein
MTSPSFTVSEQLKSWAELHNSDVLGQNLFFPSYISGLGQTFDSALVSREISTCDRVHYTNLPNLENSTLGYCLGLTMAERNVLLIVKQLDFLFLCFDQLINTINATKHYRLKHVKLLLVCLVVDTGYEGPQSCSENFDLFISASPHINVFWPSNRMETDRCLKSDGHLEDGLNILFLSQRVIFGERTYDEYTLEDSSYRHTAPYTVKLVAERCHKCLISLGFKYNRHRNHDEYGLEIHIYGTTPDPHVSLVRVLNENAVDYIDIEVANGLISYAYSLHSFLVSRYPHFKIRLL